MEAPDRLPDPGSWVAPATSPDPSSRPARRPPRPSPPEPVALRAAPLTVPQQLDAAADVLRRHAAAIVPVVLVLTMPAQVLAALARRGSDSPIAVPVGPLLVGTVTGSGPLALAIGAAVLASLALAVAGVALAPVVAADRLGAAPPGAARMLAAALRRLPVVVVAWLAARLALVAGGIAVSVAGLVALLPFVVFLSPVLALEGAGPVAALRRSASLGARRYLAALGLVCLTALTTTLVGAALAALPVLLVVAGPLEHLAWLVGGLAAQVAALVTVPLAAGAAAVGYLDARVRTEGIDLLLTLEER